MWPKNAIVPHGTVIELSSPSASGLAKQLLWLSPNVEGSIGWYHRSVFIIERLTVRIQPAHKNGGTIFLFGGQSNFLLSGQSHTGNALSEFRINAQQNHNMNAN